MIMLAINLLCDWMSEGAVGVSSGCPLMLYITSLLWFLGVVPSLAMCASRGSRLGLPFHCVDHLFVVVCGCGLHDNLSRKHSYLLLHVLCASGGVGVCGCL